MNNLSTGCKNSRPSCCGRHRTTVPRKQAKFPHLQHLLCDQIRPHIKVIKITLLITPIPLLPMTLSVSSGSFISPARYNKAIEGNPITAKMAVGTSVHTTSTTAFSRNRMAIGTIPSTFLTTPYNTNDKTRAPMVISWP